MKKKKPIWINIPRNFGGAFWGRILKIITLPRIYGRPTFIKYFPGSGCIKITSIYIY
jgi:hypothetical protein